MNAPARITPPADPLPFDHLGLDAADSCTRLVRLTSHLLQAPMVLLDASMEEGPPVTLAVGLPEEAADGIVRTGAHRPPAEVVESGEPLLASNVRESPVLSSDPMLRDLSVCACLAVPLRPVGGSPGVLWVMDRCERRWTSAEVETARNLAELVALALDLARRDREASTAIRTRDEVHRIIAHDLQSPLNTVGMAVDLLRQLLAQGASGEAVRYVDVVGRSVRYMERLTQDLLDVARLESEILSFEVERIDSAKLLAEVVEMHADAAAVRSLELVSRVPSDLPEIRADRARLLQVFANLVGNALKFTPAGGRIDLCAEPGEADLIFSVSDTGIGISAECRDHIFDRYWQANRARRAGAGLGLAIARGIVVAHGGRIWVESEEGVGTTFYFTVPLLAGA